MTYILSTSKKELCMNFCEKKAININGEFFLSETDKLFTGDTIICSNFADFGKSRSETVQNLIKILQKDVQIISVKSAISLAGMAAANALLACEEIDNGIRSNSTKAGLEKAKAEGRIGGRKIGTHPKKLKLTGHEAEISAALENGESVLSLANRYSVRWITMKEFIKNIKKSGRSSENQ